MATRSAPEERANNEEETGPSFGRSNYPSLWRNRDFKTLWFGQGVSALGDAVSITALPLLVLALTGSGLQMGIVGALQSIPDLLLGLIAGALADRFDRRKLMLLSDLGRAILTALIPLAVWLHLPVMPVVLAVTAPIAALRVLFLAAWTASLPNLVHRKQIGQANSYFEAIFSVGFIVGPGLAGVLSGWIGPGRTLAIDAVTFLVSVLSLFAIHRPLQAPTRAETPNFIADIREGIVFLIRHVTLRTVILYWTVISLAMSAVIPVLTYLITRDRGLPGSAVGLVISAYSVGYLVGSLLATRIVHGKVGYLMLASTFVSGTAMIAISQLGSVGLMAVVAAISGICEAFTLISYTTLRATETPNELLGRVGSTARTLTLGVGPLGLLLSGILLDAVRGSMTTLIFGAWVVLTAAMFSFSPVLRNARTI